MFVKITTLLLILGSSSCQQWISSGSRHEWESRVPAASSFQPSLLSLRSSEEQPMKSPLISSPEFLSSSPAAMMVEAEPITVNQRIMKKRGMQLNSRRPSPVPSPDKWWIETMRSRQQSDGSVRFVPYEYPRFPSTFTGVDGPEFLPMPIKYLKPNKNNMYNNKRKNFKKVPKPLEFEEMERVSENPPEFLPSQVETVEARLPIKLRKNHKGKKMHKSSSGSSKPELVAAASPAVYNMQSERLESVIKESTDDSDPKPLIPDKMLGNDMMFHNNRLEEKSRSGNDVDDPNDDFELIQ